MSGEGLDRERLVVSNPATLMKEYLGRVALEDEGRYDDLSIAMGQHLADYIGDDDIIPEGFNLRTCLFAIDCQTGVDGINQRPMPTQILGYPSIVYSMFTLTAIDIARDAFGDEFGNAAEQAHTRAVTRTIN